MDEQIRAIERENMLLETTNRVVMTHNALRQMMVYLLVVGLLVLMFAMLTFQFGKMYSLVVPVFLLLFPVMVLAATNSLYVQVIVVFPYCLLYFAYLSWLVVKKFQYFISIFGNIDDLMNSPACDKSFCEGWKAYMYVVFYIMLFLNLLIVGACLYLSYKVIKIEVLVDKDANALYVPAYRKNT